MLIVFGNKTERIGIFVPKIILTFTDSNDTSSRKIINDPTDEKEQKMIPLNIELIFDI